ncbi:hypothetical protein CXG81DRAFT_12393 [Caulochytrium protostelioides]|uniref:40S ribosomal protein S12 n=1 Tax=Caulochytrium protostelioides TaxID=1555241 RepID=A0A4P9X807_9FUNG|nr:hypothetical protein CXG81DRAFT_12393 [Caulochytrium protostelioides]|eukprot:RKP01111.1 hypothetical protein CXG81DRAFT_12393 [Caulochytrium protostelioides]
MSDTAETPAVEVAAAPAVEVATRALIKEAICRHALARGLHETTKALDRNEAALCILSESCDHEEYVKLIEALCNKYSTPLLKVEDSKKLGEWSQLCKVDAEGNARKIVGCSCVVVRDTGVEYLNLSKVLSHVQA